MRVLALSHLYPPHHLGGYEVMCQAVMTRLAQRGHQVMVLTSNSRLADGASESSSSGVEVRRELFLWADLRRLTPWAPSPTARLRYEWRNQRSFIRAVREMRPDVLSVWSLGFMSFSLLTLAERLRLPSAMWAANDELFEAHWYDAWTRMFTERRHLARIVASLGVETRLPALSELDVTFISRFTRDAASQKGRWRFPHADIVYPGIERSEFSPGPGACPWRWRLLYAGRVVPDKGVATVIEALPDLPSHTQLVVDGTVADSYREELQALASRLRVDGRVVFQNSGRQHLPDVYREADAVVFPSIWDEPFGLVPLEAMAAGVPVVATATGGSGEYLLDGENCLRFPPGDAKALAGQLLRLSKDQQLRDRLTTSGAATVSRYDVERFASDIERRLVTVASAGHAR